MRVNRSAMAKARIQRANDSYYYNEAIPGICDARMFRWLLRSWDAGHRRGHSCVEIEDEPRPAYAGPATGPGRPR